MLLVLLARWTDDPHLLYVPVHSAIHIASLMNPQPASPSIEAVKRRLKVLSELQSALHKMSRSVPNGMKLEFAVEPTPLEFAPPEPSTPGFRTLFTWLKEQVRYVSDDLAQIGNHDMDQQRRSVLRRLESEINRLQEMKETAWARLPATHYIQSHMSGTDHNGPLCIERGMLEVGS